MNRAAQRYWNEFCERQDHEKPQTVNAWQFGANPDHLATLVIDGVKTATCSAYIFYEKENEPLPRVDDYSIILNSGDDPVAIIKTTEVHIMPMNMVPEDFAIAEGEGDRTYQYWKEAHESFFSHQFKKMGLDFSNDILVVCERFELVDVKN